MAATFRFPKPRKREDPLASIPQFYWQDLTDLRRIGNGSFGCVDFANYRPKGSTHASPQAVVVKQLSSADAGYEKEFAKEAKLLYSVKGHPNIVEFLAVCAKPTYALMQKYEAFSFVPFSDETVVNSLATFLSHVERFEGEKLHLFRKEPNRLQGQYRRCSLRKTLIVTGDEGE